VVGRGATLSNQIGYLPDESWKERVCTLFHSIVLCKFDYITTTTIPWFLPASAGGLGMPIYRIPSWGNKYINFVLKVLDEDPIKRMATLFHLRSLGGRQKHGTNVSENTLRILRGIISSLRINDSGTFENKGNVLYTSGEMDTFLRGNGHEVRDWDDTIRLCRIYDVINIDEFLSAVENALALNEVIFDFSKKKDKWPLKRWVNRSARFWAKQQLVDEPIDPRFKDFKSLHQLCARSLGYYLRSDSTLPIVKYGTKLSFNALITSKRSMRSQVCGSNPLGFLFGN
jgi:hypothetical protein